MGFRKQAPTQEKGKTPAEADAGVLLSSAQRAGRRSEENESSKQRVSRNN